MNEESDNFRFMQIDVDYYTKSIYRLPTYLRDRLGARDPSDEVAVLRMYGVTEGGHSVMVHVHQFLSYFYVEMSSQLAAIYDHGVHAEVLKKSINTYLNI